MQETLAAPGVTPESAISTARPPLALVRAETIVYVLIALAALILRLAELDVLPLSAAEAGPALAAYKLLHPGAFITAITAPSPLVFGAQALTFSVLGATEFTARLLTALVGVGVVLSPLLFRRMLGRTRTLLLVLALFFSPVLLLASRSSSPLVWSLLLAAVGGSAVWRVFAGGGAGGAVLATVSVVGVVLLADPAGYLLVLTLVIAALLTRWTGRGDDDIEPDERWANLRGWPWLNGLAAALLVVFAVSTLFLLHQRGFNNIGALLEVGLSGIRTPAPGDPPLYALLVSVFYELFAWILALIGLLLAWRRGFPTVDRFFALWLLLGAIASLLYVGGGPDYALWLTLPLAGLTTRSLIEALREDPRNIWHFPGWARWLVAVVAVGLLSILALALQSVARSMTRLDPALGSETLSRLDPIGMILIVMVVLFSIVGFFLVASVWDRATAARGGLLGIALFGLVTSLGAGWTAAVPNGVLASEPWHLQATTDNTALLRETLYDVADRESRGEPSYPLALQASGDGLLAWLVRDFTDVRLIADPADAGDALVVLTPRRLDGDQSALSGYVGQDFVIRRGWSIAALRPYDLPAWWLQRYTMGSPAPLESVDLWLRQDVYAGAAAE